MIVNPARLERNDTQITVRRVRSVNADEPSESLCTSSPDSVNTVPVDYG